jgi:hypothetical protein
VTGTPARRAFFVALAWLAAVAGALLVFAVRAGSSFTDSGSSLVMAGIVLAFASDASVGAVLALRRPGNVVGLLLMLGAVLGAVTLLGWVWGSALTAERGQYDVLAGFASLVGGLGFTPSLFVAGPLLALVFPNGRLPGPRWRWPVGAIVAAIVVGSAIWLVRPGPIPASLANNPFGVSGLSGYEAPWTIGEALVLASLPAALLLAIAAVIVRFRRSDRVERAQLKWFVAANVAVGAFVTLGFADGGYLGLAAGSSPTVLDLLAYASLSLPPIAVGVAILRYRLYEIDRIISRTISYGILTAVLVAVFASVVVGLQTVLTPLTGGDTLPVAASTLVVFALFQPLRRRVQSAIDRRFDRARYDGERTAAAFAGRLRDEVDLNSIIQDLRSVVGASLQPGSASVWIRSRNESRTLEA